MEENYSQEDYYEDAGVMYELIRQFEDKLSGKENPDELNILIKEEAVFIHEQIPEIPIDYIIQEINLRIGH